MLGCALYIRYVLSFEKYSIQIIMETRRKIFSSGVGAEIFVYVLLAVLHHSLAFKFNYCR
jgi:hypothetical protein